MYVILGLSKKWNCVNLAQVLLQYFEDWRWLRDGSSVSQNSTSKKEVLFGFNSSILVCLVMEDFRNLKKMLYVVIQLLKLSF